MALHPVGVDDLERPAEVVARADRVPAADQVDDQLVEERRVLPLVVERGDDLRLVVREAREHVEHELEGDVPRGADDEPLHRELAPCVGDRVVNARLLLLRELHDRLELLGGVALGREGDGLRGEDAAELEERDGQIEPRRIARLKGADERGERVEPRALAPGGDERARTVPGGHEAQRLEPRERRAQRQAIDPERERELPLRREARPGLEPAGEDFAAQPVGHGVDDAGARDGAEDGERLGRSRRRT